MGIASLYPSYDPGPTISPSPILLFRKLRYAPCALRLLSLKFWFSFFQKSGHPFFFILGPEQHTEYPLFYL
jgi:hypothetical protein